MKWNPTPAYHRALGWNGPLGVVAWGRYRVARQQGRKGGERWRMVRRAAFPKTADQGFQTE